MRHVSRGFGKHATTCTTKVARDWLFNFPVNIRIKSLKEEFSPEVRCRTLYKRPQLLRKLKKSSIDFSNDSKHFRKSFSNIFFIFFNDTHREKLVFY